MNDEVADGSDGRFPTACKAPRRHDDVGHILLPGSRHYQLAWFFHLRKEFPSQLQKKKLEDLKVERDCSHKIAEIEMEMRLK